MRIFKEEQRFTQTWLLVLLTVSAIAPIVIVFKEYRTNEISFNKLIGTLALIFFATILIFFFKLKTRIDEIGIHYQFFPFHLKLKTIAWSELKSAETRNYDAISEFGGWGLKGGFFWNKKKGTAINVSGDIGIQLTFKNGKKILIGTQLLNEANAVLKTYKNKINE
ncbi:MAG: hypothetical protein P8H13_06330 [Polaribacter sp.]|nr:hypothetical protein [Polaribacter sp.]MDG1811536.1 hypothetical protein [Polaribacter sp.]MDG1993266.1 hypothetical protein [Polaribacter sp.]